MEYNHCLSFEETFNIETLKMSDERIQKRTKNKNKFKNWDKRKEYNQNLLLKDLLKGRYEMSPYYIVDVMLEKPRTLAILPHRDRIVQDMILQSMKSYFDKIFIKHSYACIVGRGTTKCVKDLQKILKEDPINTKYYIQLDIKKYFPSINNGILKQLIRKSIKDEKLLFYHDKLIDSYDGLPIGNSTSQYYANLFISYELHKILSKFNKHKIYIFVYMDDIIILCKNKKYLIDIRDHINVNFGNIKLRLKNPNAQVYVVRKNGIRFLGFILFGTHTLIRKNVMKKCWKLINNYCYGKISKIEFSKSYCTYSGLFKLANTQGLCKHLYEYILNKTGEKFYFNNWNGELVKIRDFKNKNIKIIDLTSFNKNYRIDFIYKDKPYRILTKSKKLINKLKQRKRPFNYIFV